MCDTKDVFFFWHFRFLSRCHVPSAITVYNSFVQVSSHACHFLRVRIFLGREIDEFHGRLISIMKFISFGLIISEDYFRESSARAYNVSFQKKCGKF